jgi:hypothetical protein
MIMVESQRNRNPEIANSETRWTDLYRLGAVSCAIVAASVIFAVVVFFIWPYAPGRLSTSEIFAFLQNHTLGGLIALDLPLLLIELVSIPPLLALYVALKPVNESYALVALVVGLMAIVLSVQSRPLAELVLLSEGHAEATTEAARGQYLAAGQALLAYFDGTAWMVFTVFIAISGLISSLLMLRSPLFSRATAYVGVVATLPGFGFFIPVLGPLLLFVATFGGIVWYAMVARAFFRLGWNET